MTTTQAATLRQKWNQRTNQECEHKMLELETSEQAYLTGNLTASFAGPRGSKANEVMPLTGPITA